MAIAKIYIVNNSSQVKNRSNKLLLTISFTIGIVSLFKIVTAQIIATITLIKLIIIILEYILVSTDLIVFLLKYIMVNIKL